MNMNTMAKIGYQLYMWCLIGKLSNSYELKIACDSVRFIYE